MKIAEEQCKSELSTIPPCNMPRPRYPRPRPSVYRFISTATGSRRSDTICRTHSISEAEINSTILTDR